MIQDRKFNSFLTRLTPAPKLWLALGIIIAVFTLKNLYFSLFIGLASIYLIVREGHIKLFKGLAIIMIILFISMYAIHGTMAPVIDKELHTPIFQIFGINYYKEGFMYATSFYMRIFPLMSCLFLLFITIDMTDLSVVMIEAGLPYKAVFSFVDSFQVIKLLNKDMNQILDAQKARGLKVEGRLIDRIKAFGPIIVPVVSNAVFRIQDQALAMDTKGFNSNAKKTVYRELEPSKWDNLIKIIGISLSILSLLYWIRVRRNIIDPFLSNIIV